MDLSVLDTAIVLFYFALVMTVAAVFVNLKATPEEFAVNKHHYGRKRLGFSFGSLMVSTLGFIAVLDSGYLMRSSIFMQLIALPIAGYFVGQWCVRLVKVNNELTLYSYLGKRLGSWAMLYAGGCFSLLTLMRTAITLYLIMKVLSNGGVQQSLVICILIGVLITFYIYLGGMSGIIWTNAFMTPMKFLGLGAVVVYLCMQLIFGNERTIAESLNIDWSSILHPTFLVFLMFATMIDMFVFGFSQASTQLYLSARSEQEAKKGLWIGLGLMSVILSLLWTIGYLTQLYITQHPDLVVLFSQEGANVFIILMRHILPEGVKALFLISFLTVGLNVAVIDLNTLAILFYNDFFRHNWEPTSITRQQQLIPQYKTLYVHKIAFVIGVLILLIAISLYRWNPIDYLFLWWNVTTILVGSTLGLFLLATASKKAFAPGAIMGITTGVFIAIMWIMIGNIYETLLLPLHELGNLLLLPLSMAIMVVMSYLSSFIFPRKEHSCVARR